MQFGEQVPVFGLDKLRIVEWLTELLDIPEDDLCKRAGELQLPQLILRLVGIYYMNTTFHELALRMFKNAMMSTEDPFLLTVSLGTAFLVRLQMPSP